MQSPRSLRMLDVLSILAFVVAAGLYFWPVSVSVPANAAVTMPTLTSRTAPLLANDNEAATVVASNILSSSRRAPTVRYTSPDLLPAPDYSLPAAFATTPLPDSALDGADGQDAVPSLYGIVNTDGSRRALIRLTESDPNPALLREGDRRGLYVVTSIRPKEVVVTGPAGQRTLRLARASRRDSTGNFL